VKGGKTDKENADAKLGTLNACLLDHLDGALWALCFAGSADEAVFRFGWVRFAIFDFVDADGAGVDTGFASVAFCVIYYYFYHVHTSYFSLKAVLSNKRV
jgi:hypothetical protein